MVTHKIIAMRRRSEGLFPGGWYLAYPCLGLYFYRLAYETIER
jgi:hypothetical protein